MADNPDRHGLSERAVAATRAESQRDDKANPDETMAGSRTAFFDNITVSGGPAPARAYIEELLPDILEGRIEPGRVFDRVIGLDEVPEGYRAMDDREAIKVMVEP